MTAPSLPHTWTAAGCEVIEDLLEDIAQAMDAIAQ
jgi:hypothetical protein